MSQPSTESPSSAPAPASSPGAARKRPGALSRIAGQDFIGVLAAIVVLVAVIGIARPDFLSGGQLSDLLNQASSIAILAMGMAFLLAMRELDLSAGSVYGLTALVAASVGSSGSSWLGVVLAILVGACLGLFNGVLIQLFALPSIVATLATLAMFRGLNQAISEGEQTIGPSIEDSFSRLMTAEVLSVPVTGIVMLVVAAVLVVVLRSTPFGNRVRAIGSNPEAAAFSGIPVGRVRLQAFVLIGALGGLAGAMTVGYLGAADPNLGTGYELQAIAAAVIGGTPLIGGRATVVGAVLGALLLAVVASGLAYFDVPINWNAFATGAVILGAVSLDSALRRRRSRAGVGL